MTYALTIQQQPGYLHFCVTGSNTASNVSRYFEEVLRECIARQCYRALIEERLEGPRLKIMDVFELVAEGSSRALGVLEAVAYVDVYAEGGDMLKFAETVAVNRAIPVRMFAIVADAERWLVKDARGEAEPNASRDARGTRC